MIIPLDVFPFLKTRRTLSLRSPGAKYMITTNLKTKSRAKVPIYGSNLA